MQKSVLSCLALMLIASAIASHLPAQEPKTPAAEKQTSEQPSATVAATAPTTNVSSLLKRHPWGRFEPGAWSVVIVVNETFDEQGALVSTGTTETRTTLLKVEDDGVTLQFETSAWVSGKRLDAKPQTVKQCFHGGLCGSDVKVTELPAAALSIDGRKIDCEVELAEMLDGNLRTSIRTYYNDTISPFVFKRVSETVNLENKISVTKMTIEADALNMPCEVLDEIRSAAHFRITREQASGARSTTLAYMSPEIPGGTIRHSSVDLDPNGRVVGRSILKLTDFGSEAEDQRPGLLRRRVKSAKLQRALRRAEQCPPTLNDADGN